MRRTVLPVNALSSEALIYGVAGSSVVIKVILTLDYFYWYFTLGFHTLPIIDFWNMALLPQSTKDLLLKRGHLRYVKFFISTIFLLGILLGVGLHLCRRETESDRVNITTEGLKKIPYQSLKALSSQELAQIPLKPVATISEIPQLPTDKRTNLTIEERLSLESLEERLSLESQDQNILKITNLVDLQKNIGSFVKLTEFPPHLFKPDSSLAKYEELVKRSGDFISVINSITAAQANQDFTLTGSGRVKKSNRRSFSRVLDFVSRLEREELHKELLCFSTEYNLKVEDRNVIYKLVRIIEGETALFDVVKEEVLSSYLSTLKEIKSVKEKAGDLQSLNLLIEKKFIILKDLFDNMEVFEKALTLIPKKIEEIEATEENVNILGKFNSLFTNCAVANGKKAVLMQKTKEEKDRQVEEERKRVEEERRLAEEERKRLEEEQKRVEEQKKLEEQKRVEEEAKKLEGEPGKPKPVEKPEEEKKKPRRRRKEGLEKLEPCESQRINRLRKWQDWKRKE